MTKQKLSQTEKIKIFLNEYYTGYGPYISFIRVMGGPLILILAVSMYQDGIAKELFSYPSFMILFGIYFILKPVVMLLLHKTWFRNFDFDYTITEEKILIQSDKSSSELHFSDIKAIKKRKSYFALQTKFKQGIYLPIQNLEASEIKILDRRTKK